MNGQRTVLFIDEIHRFNKAQQDALLPYVEDGTITLTGTTTENPYFEVNSALLSRMRVWRLEALTDEDVGTVVRRALEDDQRGLAGSLGPEGGVALAEDAFDHLVGLAGGDARSALNVLEGAVALAESEGVRDTDGKVTPRLEDVEAAAQQRVLAYDRAGDGHYDTVSAFIKSLRGNDPDAALYWLASMVAAGEDPRFIARRLIISRVGGRRQRRSAGAPGCGGSGSGARPRRAPGGAVRTGAGDDVHRHRPEVEPVGLGVLGGRERRRRARLATGAAPPPPGAASADAATRHRGRLSVPHDFEEADVAQQYLPDELRTGAITCRPSRATRPPSRTG